MQAFRDGRGTMFNIPERMKLKELSKFLWGDYNPLDRTASYPTVIFTFDGTTCGDQLFLFVTAEGLLVVPPFPSTGARSAIPLFPEERACSASR